MDLIRLIGDIDENFYQLGLKDKDLGKVVHQDVRHMLRTPWNNVNKLIQDIGQSIIKNTLVKNTDHYRHLKAYSEGMGIKIEECAYVMLIPEIVSAMTKWAPGFIKGNLGCSTFILRNNDGDVTHGRILDFPLQGSYDRYERAILYDLNGMPKTLGFGSSGIPYPSITLMTEDGLTLALHQKFTNVFNPKGISIFEFIFKMIKEARDKKSIVEFIKRNQTITTWCLYMTFSDGEVLACDLNGPDSFINELKVPDSGILYFCNHLEDKSIDQRQFLPLGFDQYNQMRADIAQQKIELFLSKNKTQPTDLELLELMSKPHNQKLKINSFNKYNLDNLTASTLSLMVMNSTKRSALNVNGPAPKVFRDDISEIKNIFDRQLVTKLKVNKKSLFDTEYFQGLHLIMEAQKAFDSHDSILLYHNLQMAIDHLENYPEKNIAHFYFLIAQYLNETYPQVLAHLLSEFKNFEGNLPPYLNDHCIMFIGRLERILRLAPSISIDNIQTQKLREIYNRELKIPTAIFHYTSKSMIIPRIDILDIIYILSA